MCNRTTSVVGHDTVSATVNDRDRVCRSNLRSSFAAKYPCIFYKMPDPNSLFPPFYPQGF
jgi:hypothetical protein